MYNNLRHGGMWDYPWWLLLDPQVILHRKLVSLCCNEVTSIENKLHRDLSGLA